MLADAVRAESFRLSRNRSVLFWSVLFVPVVGLVLTVAGHLFTKANEARLASASIDITVPGGPLDLFQLLVGSAAALANPAMLMFLTIGAATLYAGDYRWESWRLISARNTRPNLLAAKVVVFIGLTLAASAAYLVADGVAALVQAVVFARPLTFGIDGEGLGEMGLLAVLSWVRIVQFTMIGLLAAVVTRSLLAALFVPLVVGVAQAVAPQMLMGLGIMPDSWLAPLLSPALASDGLQGLIQGGMADQALVKGLVSLALWTLVPLAGALAVFQRQDLSKE